ncbi:MAG: DUF1269 domain-containing protein [Gammaproteobacteria bacterium]|nr:DUF1269 domain-containing protein [Gammaproteobacteria bacterium]
MRRLHFLLPTVESCEQVVNELEAQGVPHKHLHAVASIRLPIDDLPEATIWQTSELAHGIEWGLGLGGSAGLLGTLLAVAFPPAGLVIGGGALLAGAAAGASVGAVTLGMMKVHEHNHSLDEYKQEIERGEILLMVDVPKGEVAKTESSILKHHPEAHIKHSEIKR